MIYRKRLTALALAGLMGTMALVPSSSAFAAVTGAWTKVNGIYQMVDGTSIDGVISRGIDVSRWQETIDWNAVAADDIQFVMLGTKSSGGVDPYFHANAAGAHAAGVKLGAYIYSYATTVEMAIEEADFVLNLIKDYPISFPVAFDVESNAMAALSPADLSTVINAFCQRIEAAGYHPMVYANDYWLANKIDVSQVNYDIWVARYEKRHIFSTPTMWQATSTGKVNGIKGNVDINFLYKDYSNVIPANTWRTIGGTTYYYKDYVMQKNAWINDGDGWYYMNDQGTASKGWLQKDGNHYYLDETTGKMAIGWKQLDNKWYFLDGSGVMSVGWVQDGNSRYFMNDDGTMATGWLTQNNQKYYLGSSGAMATGWKQIDGKWYHMDANGVMNTGWLQDGDSKYYLYNDGTMAAGWVDVDGKTYYLAENGAMATGWKQHDNSWYYLNGDGTKASGWINPDGSWYYLNNEGKMQTGWFTDNTGTYYLSGSSGKMTVGWRQVDDGWYYFNGSGQLQKGMLNINGAAYYLDPNTGRMAVNTAFTIDGINYTSDENGICQQVVPETAPEGEGAGIPADQTPAAGPDISQGQDPQGNAGGSGETQAESKPAPKGPGEM